MSSSSENEQSKNASHIKINISSLSARLASATKKCSPRTNSKALIPPEKPREWDSTYKQQYNNNQIALDISPRESSKEEQNSRPEREYCVWTQRGTELN